MILSEIARKLQRNENCEMMGFRGCWEILEIF